MVVQFGRVADSEPIERSKQEARDFMWSLLCYSSCWHFETMFNANT